MKWVYVSLLAVLASLYAIGSVEGQESSPGSTVLQIGCGVAKTATIDPILDPPKGEAHEHVFFGNRGVNAASTSKSLTKNKATTCNKAFDTSSYWHPVLRDGSGRIPVQKTVVYYSGTGEPGAIKPIPRGLELIGRKADYRCGFAAPQDTPPYGCKNDFLRVRVHFPQCWNEQGKSHENTVYAKGGKCPETHPYRIPNIRMGTHLDNSSGFQRPLEVAHGGGMWMDHTYMHGDVFNAGQQPAFDAAIKRCVVNKPAGKSDKFCQPGN